MQSFKSGSEVIHFDDKGPKTDFAIIFLNSLGTDIRVWDKLLNVLGEFQLGISFNWAQPYEVATPGGRTPQGFFETIFPGGLQDPSEGQN